MAASIFLSPTMAKILISSLWVYIKKEFSYSFTL